jgi:CubicO group peptidase (beta-lactamase class C family)
VHLTQHLQQVPRIIALIVGIALWNTSVHAADAHAPTNGTPRQWLVLAPVALKPTGTVSAGDAEELAAFKTDHLAAVGGETAASPKAGLKVNLGTSEFEWRIVDATNGLLDPAPGATNAFSFAYAWAEISSPSRQTNLALINPNPGLTIWLNGKQIFHKWDATPAGADWELAKFELKPGANRVLVKVSNPHGKALFGFRFLDADGLAAQLALAAISSDTDRAALLIEAGADVNRPRRLLTPWQEARISGNDVVADFLAAHGADIHRDMPEPGAIIDAALSEAPKLDAGGLSLLVARNGTILYQKGWGVANRDAKAAFTPDTVSRIGSVTKQFTAAAILLLQERGKLAVTDPVSKFFPDFPRGDVITLHHLLTHTSGIHNYTDKPDFYDTVTLPATTGEMIDRFRNDPPDFAPGAKFSYSNSGYFLLGAIIEKVSGTSYANFLREEFFTPLGMVHSGVHTGAPIDNEAKGYAWANGAVSPALNWSMSRAGGAGALYSTVGDLFRWNEALFHGKVLSKESLDAAWKPAATETDRAPETGYGYGFGIVRTRGLLEITHTGGLHGFLSVLFRFPEKGLTIAVLGNLSDPPPQLSPAAIGSRIAELYLWREMLRRDQPKVAHADPKELAAAVGRYDYGAASMEVTSDGGCLFAQLTGQPKYEIFPKGDSTWFWKVVDARVRFVHDAAGRVVEAEHHQNGQTIHAKRLPDVAAIALDDAALDAYTGRYDYGGGAVLTVSRDGRRLFAQMTSQPRFEIYPKAKDAFMWKVIVADIEFKRDPSGHVVAAEHHQAGQTIPAKKLD